MDEEIWKEQFGLFKDKIRTPYIPNGALPLENVTAIETRKSGRWEHLIYCLKDGQRYRVTQRVHIDILAILSRNNFENTDIEIYVATNGSKRAKQVE